MFAELSNSYAQTCGNSPSTINNYLYNNNIGIHTAANGPLKSLHIDSWPLDCKDPAIRLSYQAQPNPYFGHLALVTPGNFGLYSALANEKSVILQADSYAEDLFLTTRNNFGDIRFSTTPILNEPDVERMVITHDGFTGIAQHSPKDLLHVGQMTTLSDYSINFNSFFDNTVGNYKNILSSHTVVKFGIDKRGVSNPGAFWYIDEAPSYSGGTVFHYNPSNPELIKGIRMTNDGEIGIGTNNPLGTLDIILRDPALDWINLPRITFDRENTSPVIKMYKWTGIDDATCDYSKDKVQP